MAEFKEYPKMIYIEGKGKIVNSKEEEDKLNAPVKTVKEKPATWGN